MWWRCKKKDAFVFRSPKNDLPFVDPDSPLDLQMLRAIEANSLAALKAALDDGAHPDGPCWVIPPLLRALREGDIRLSQCLLERGADPNCLDSGGRAPVLVLSDECRRPDCEGPFRSRLALLLEFGSLLNAHDTSRRTAGFFLAIWGNRGPLRAFLEFGGAIPSGRRWRKMHKERALFDEVLATIPDYQPRSEPTIEDVKPVLRILKARHAEEIDYALELGANPSDCLGAERVFCIRARDNNSEIIRRLLEEGADPNMQEGSPLVEAMYYESWRSFEVLLEFGADPDYEPQPFSEVHRDIIGNPTLSQELARSGMTVLNFLLYIYDTATKLIRMRGDVVCYDDFRDLRRRIVMVLGTGADPNRNPKGEALLAIAKRIGDPELIRELEFFGARDGS